MQVKKSRWNGLTAKIKMRKCIIVGAGTYGQVYAKYLSEEYDILGYVDDNTDLLNLEVYGHSVLGRVEALFQPGRFDVAETCVFVPIGDNPVRQQLLTKVRAFGYRTPSFIHSSVIMDSSVKVEEP